jgi:hypothetical protein
MDRRHRESHPDPGYNRQRIAELGDVPPDAGVTPAVSQRTRIGDDS